MSSTHPSIQTLIASSLPTSHPNVDMLLADPANHPIPASHPLLSDLVSRRSPVVFTVGVSGYHVNVSQSYALGKAMPPTHPSVQDLMGPVLSATHPNVDDMLRDPVNNPLPYWHPDLENYIWRREALGSLGWGGLLPVVNIAYDHPDIDAAYARGDKLPNTNSFMPNHHPKVGPMMAHKLPAAHPDVDMLLANPSAYPLPAWHPRLNDMTERRSFWSPGIIFSLVMVSVMFILFLLRVCKKTKKTVRRSSQIYNPIAARSSRASGVYCSSRVRPHTRVCKCIQ